MAERRRLIFMVADRAYLLPTVVAAMQAMQQPEVAALADLTLYLAGSADRERDALRAAFAGFPIGFEHLPEPASAADGFEQDTHVSRATMGRLAVAPHIPDRYDHLLYLDGDIQIVGDIAPLVRHDVAPGHILAAPDSVMLISRDGSAFARDNDGYVHALGVRSRRDYFNAGILAMRRTDWIAIAEAALAFHAANRALCRYDDQSALNAVTAGRREHLHPAYNFMPAYRRTGTRRITPAIIHFIGPVKPWHPGSDFGDPALQDAYAAALQAFPILRQFPPAAPWATADLAVHRHTGGGIRNWWAQRARRRRLDAYLRSTRFAFLA